MPSTRLGGQVTRPARTRRAHSLNPADQRPPGAARGTPELVETLDEPLQHASERVRTGHAGVGLGLAIVKGIAQAHDGTLTLRPRDPGGLSVTVQLPSAPRDVGR